MDLQDQLRNLFPEHVPEEGSKPDPERPKFWLQEEPILCKYEKRKGKPVTILEGYNGADKDLKAMQPFRQAYCETSRGGLHFYCGIGEPDG